tara:strand:+ start:64 stop:324 length:261 start_codon:yes stop_codon:yes gene_type:complete
MSVYLTKGANLGKATIILDGAAKTSSTTNGPWVAVNFLAANSATMTVDGAAFAATTYGANAWVYGEITAIDGDGADYVLYSAQRDI